MSEFLRFSDVTFRYLSEAKTNILEHTDLYIEKGKTTVIIGGSGCGKSTLALLAAGIYPANGGQLLSGEISIMGHPVSALSIPERTRLLSVLFQNPDLQFCMDTLYKELIFCLENLSFSPEEMKKMIETFSKKYSVESLLNRKLSTLSGGEKQKAALCCLLLLGSEGILLDEPFANLDPEAAAMLTKLLGQAAADEGITVVAIDHKLDFWLPHADEIIVLGQEGNVISRGINRSNISEYRRLFFREGLFFPDFSETSHLLPRKKKKKQQLTLENVSLGYPECPLLSKVNAEFCAASMTALLGASGSGKTSLFSAILGCASYGGSIRLEGAEIKKLKRKQLYAQVSAVFQNPASQFVALNVLAEVIYSLRQWHPKLKKEELEEKAMALLEIYGLKKYKNFSPYMLSQGQQRRLAVLTMLAGSQTLLLLDEPTYGQDKKHTELMMEQLKDLVKNGITVIFSTHDREIAVKYSDYIYEIREGRILPWSG